MTQPSQESSLHTLNDRRISGDAVGLVRDFLLQHSTSADPLLARLQSFKDADRMTFQQWWSTLDLLQERFPNRHIAVELGQIIRPHHLGILAYCVHSCPHLLEALQRIARHQEILHEGDLARLSMTADQVTLRWDRNFAPSQQLSDEVMLLSLWQFIRLIVDRPDLPVASVTTIWPESSARQSMEHCLGGAIQYQAEFNSISFALDYLKLPISDSLSLNHSLFSDTGPTNKILETSALNAAVSDNELAQGSASHKQRQPLLPDYKIFDAIPNSQLTGKDTQDKIAPTTKVPLPDLLNHQNDFLKHCSYEILRSIQNGQLHAAHVAKQLAVSERTLHRRLNQCDINFRNLTLSVRIGLAKQYLADKRLSILEVALLAGYSDQVAFSRAFKKMTGKTPRTYFKSINKG